VTSPLSGEQWTIRHGGHEVTVVQVGGGLRTYMLDGIDVVAGYRAAEVARAGRGQLLMPWPNRVRDGRYTWGGSEHQLTLSEPAHLNASHGLVRWLPWQGTRRGESTVAVTARLFPQPGWDGLLDLEVVYAVGDEGLAVTSTATNVGPGPAPFGYGAHPYVAIGDTPLADVMLRVPAAVEVLVDERLLPTGTAPVRPDVDFRHPRSVDSPKLDTAYTQVDRDPVSGRWEVAISGLRDRPDVTVWGDEAFEWVQVFTAQAADTGVNGSRGVAVEPMSCPADAFNSRAGLVTLEPGQSWTGTWGIRPESG
jgi:aldose 1-epimerase